DGVSYENFFLAVGTRQPAKNIPGIIKSFALFCNNYDTRDHKLYVVGGGGWGNDACAKLAADLNMQGRIIFTGYIPEEQLDELYKTCKGHIMLSFYEGFGIPILEALSWHKPSIASNVSSLPEVMGKTGIQVDPRNHEQVALAIKAVAENPTNYLSDIEGQLIKFSK
ncbi:glycosyl transferase group 1, partial [mine drainage metagenome]